MAFHGRRFALKHLGTLRGRGSLSIRRGRRLGAVDYEIDGYVDAKQRSANGRLEGSIDILRQAFDAGAAHITLEGGLAVDVVLADPQGEPAAEFVVRGPPPSFGH
jgi:hypothetical protein